MTLGRARTELKSFVDLLQGVRERVGKPTFREIEKFSAGHRRPLAKSTIANKLKLQSPPDWDFVDAFLLSCECYARTAKGRALTPSDSTVIRDPDTRELTFDRARWRRRHDRTLAILEKQHEDDRFAAQAKLERDRRLLPEQLPPHTRRFTGRGRELDDLDRLLGLAGQTDESGEICVVHGTAGVGKTALAVRWAHRVSKRFPDGQLYVNLQGFDPHGAPLLPAQALRGFLDAFGVPRDRLPATVADQAKLFRSLVSERKVLVVLDNAASVEQVRPLLPGSSPCRVLITSRVRLTGLVAKEGATELRVAPFPAGDAGDLVARHVRDERVEREPGSVAEMGRLCAYLPLAICVVAARARSRPELRLADVVAELNDEATALSAMQTGDDIESDVRAAFSWSYRYLYGPAARLFRLLATHPGPDITVTAVASLFAVDLATARSLLDDLAAVELIEEHVPGRFAFHDLLRLYATELGRDHDSAAERAATRGRTYDHYLHSVHAAALAWDPHRDPLPLSDPLPGVRPDDVDESHTALSWLSREYAVLLAVARQSGERAWPIVWCLVDFMHRQGHWTDGGPVLREAAAAAARVGDTEGQARMERGLSGLAAVRRDRAAAQHHLQTAMALYTAAGDELGQAHVYLELAKLSAEPEAALDDAERSLRCYRAAGSAPGEGNALNAVGWFHAQLGHLDRGLACCTGALRILEPLDDVAGLGAVLDSLGYIYGQLGRHDEVDRYYRQALALFERSDDPVMQADTLEHIGANLRAADRPDEARAAYEQAIPLYEQVERYAEAEAVRLLLDEFDRERRHGA